MNPVRLLKLLARVNALLNLIEKGRMNKALWQSKTFWFNVLSAAASVADIIPLPPATVGVIVSLINIGLRIVTTQGVTVVPGSGAK